jgi:RNA exonuclease 4
MRKRLKSEFVLELSVLVEVFMGRALGFQGEDSVWLACYMPGESSSSSYVKLEFSRAAMDLFRSCEGVFESAIAAGTWPCDLPLELYANHYT